MTNPQVRGATAALETHLWGGEGGALLQWRGGSRQQIHGGCGKTPARVWQEGHEADPPTPEAPAFAVP